VRSITEKVAEARRGLSGVALTSEEVRKLDNLLKALAEVNPDSWCGAWRAVSVDKRSLLARSVEVDGEGKVLA
jgi:hypothetical protein